MSQAFPRAQGYQDAVNAFIASSTALFGCTPGALPVFDAGYPAAVLTKTALRPHQIGARVKSPSTSRPSP